jgi:hypothetical protein
VLGLALLELLLQVAAAELVLAERQHVTLPHFAELMTDPFANYLAQRLLEYATDEQRDALIEMRVTTFKLSARMSDWTWRRVLR